MPALVDRPTAGRAPRRLPRADRPQPHPGDGPLLEPAPRLEAVGRLGVGLDNIDVEACRSRRIEVFPATGANDLAVVEYVITAALMLLRGAWLDAADMLAGPWPRNRLMASRTRRQDHGPRRLRQHRP